MPILPQVALAVMFQFWPLVVSLVQQWQAAFFLEKYRRHPLVQLAQLLDFAPFEQGCAGFHKGSGRGSAVTHSVPRLVRALLVKYLFDLSYRQTEEWLDLHWLVRWFVGYSWAENPPDHTTLNRFELWVLREQPDLFFDETMRQVDHHFPQDRQRLQVADTFAMLARGARCSLISLIRDVCREVLDALEQADPDRYEHVLAQIDPVALFGQPGEKPSRALNPQEREARLQSLVSATLKLHRLVSAGLTQAPCLPPDRQAPVLEWLGYLDKIITDETTVSQPDPAEPDQVTVKERPHGQKGAYRIGCANAPEASYRHHGADKGEGAKLGYNAAVLGTRDFIRWTEGYTGACPDEATFPDLLQQQASHQGFWPRKVVIDQAGGTGSCRAAINRVSGGQTQVIALVPDYDKRTDRFVPADFSLSADGLSLTCLNDVTTTKVYVKPGAEGREFRFSAQLCQGCPFWVTAAQLAQQPDRPHCRKPDGKPTGHRQVFISDHREYILAALAYNKTEQFKQEIKQRPHIERLIYNLTNLLGARRAKSTGLPKINFQLRMAATAFNLHQLVRLLGRRPKLATA